MCPPIGGSDFPHPSIGIRPASPNRGGKKKYIYIYTYIYRRTAALTQHALPPRTQFRGTKVGKEQVGQRNTFRELSNVVKTNSSRP